MPRPIVMPSLASKVASARLERSALRSNREGKPAETGKEAKAAVSFGRGLCALQISRVGCWVFGVRVVCVV